MRETRGVVVMGKAREEHRISSDTSGFMQGSHEPLQGMDWSKAYGAGKRPISCVNNCDAMIAAYRSPLAMHVSPVLLEDVTVTNKISQNLHGEMFLHDLGAAGLADGWTGNGARVVRAFLERAGADKDDFVFFDGSGVSGHDLVAPRATARLLQYESKQHWFSYWRRTLAVGGERRCFGESVIKA